MRQQKAFVLIVSPTVVGNVEEGNTQYNNLHELNELFEDGWRFLSSAPMSSAETKYSVSLVILEKGDK